ncbi:phospholipase A2 inhibitor LNF2-like [Anolis carolinensis]|uniref:phospholipase A2 inhibitor LNF2-like n=1 Tax=Anolis carolinensis TaxID=28377 RepID=UPI002F2B5E00
MNMSFNNETLLGLFFCSLLLITGNSLMCEVCQGVGNNCTGKKVTCRVKEDACATMWIDVTSDIPEGNLSSHDHENPETVITTRIISKGCTSMAVCRFLKITIGIPAWQKTLRKIVCSLAPPTAAFLPLTFSGFLLMKIFL